MTDFVETENRAVQVTFFEDRAQVVRRAEVELAAGTHPLRLPGVSLLVDDTTLQVRATDASGTPVRVLASRVLRSMRSVAAASDEEVEALAERRRAAWKELEGARRRLALTQNEQQRVVALEQALLRSMYRVPRAGDVSTDEWGGSLDRLGHAFDTALGEQLEVRNTVTDLAKAELRARMLLEEAKKKNPEIRSEIETEVRLEEAAKITIEATYFVPCALWRPSHVARLSEDRRSVKVDLMATVWQVTGEQWDDIEATFSTARPTKIAEAPLLSDDYLRSRPKTDFEKNVVAVEARDVDISVTGAEGSRAIDEMPGVDDGGEPVRFQATEAVTIESTGEPFRVELGGAEADCSTRLVAYPERSPVAYLASRLTWKHTTPLLAGPVVTMRGNEFAGRSRVDFAGPGEAVELSFGVDSGISVHRSVDDEHKTSRMTGKNTLNRTVKVFVSNLSGETKFVNIVERIPVSEIEEVTVKDVQAAAKPDTDGFVEFAVELGPRKVETLELSYRVDYGSKVRLSW